MSLANTFYDTHPLKLFTCDGKSLEYISAGEGAQTILLLPGGGQTAQSNFALIKALETQHKVIALTLYDVGSIFEFCHTINALLDHEKVRRVHIYGLSIGGLIAQSYLWRNKQRVESLIISHACTPESKRYKLKIVIPLRALGIFLPVIPDGLISLFAKLFASKIQRGSSGKLPKDPIMAEPVNKELTAYFTQEFYRKYVTKTLIRTWINLHTDFYLHEKFAPSDLKDWFGKVLILRTENDPLMQDEGYFVKLYPSANVYTFCGTGHLTFYYQFSKILKHITDFLV